MLKRELLREPELIYDVFSAILVKLPLVSLLPTFTLLCPKHRGNPVDYWIRLNKAPDLALGDLHRRGKQTNSMNDEVVLMFIKHCPDPELSCIWKCKPIHEWTSHDVQLRIDDYQRELRANYRTAGATRLKSQVTTVTSEQPCPPSFSLAAYEQCHTPSPSPSSLQAKPHICHPPCPSPVPVSAQGDPQHAQSQASIPLVAQNLQQSEERLLTHMVDMFQGMMGKMQQRNTSHPIGGGRFHCAPCE